MKACKECGEKYNSGLGTFLPDGSLVCARCHFRGQDYGHQFQGLYVSISRGLYVVYLEYDVYQWNQQYQDHSRTISFCEYGSEIAEKILRPKHYGHELYWKMTTLVEKNQAYLLGEEGIRAYQETAEDRRLVDILNHGGKMDMETGNIVDPLTGEKI